MRPLGTWGLQARTGTAATLALLMATAVAASVAGPLLLRAVEQSALTRAVADAGPVRTSVSVSAQVTPYQTAHDNLVAAQTAVLAASNRLFRPAVTSQESQSAVRWRSGTEPAQRGAKSRLVSTDRCAGVRFRSGRCPAQVTEVAISSLDARTLRLGLGSALALTLPTLDATRTRTVPLTVTGVYDAAASPGVSLTTPGSPDAVISGATATDLMVTATTLAALQLTVEASAHRVLARPLRLADLPEVRGSIQLVRDGALRETGSFVVDSTLPGLLDDLTTEDRAATTIIWVIQAQALALALGAIAVVLQRISRARAREWAVGRLRGLPPRTWLVSVYTEPVLSLAAGVPVGALVGVLAARVTTNLALRTGTPLEPWRAPVVLSVLAAAAGASIVLVAASVRSARVDLAQLLGSSTEERRISRLAAVGQSAAVLLAAVTTWQLVAGNGGSQDRLGLLAPGLFALALAVLAAQAVTWWVRRAATTPTGRLGTLVVARQLGRTPSVLLRGVVIAIGVSLVVFVTQLTWASVQNQDRLAAAEVGSAQVLQVEPPAKADLRSLVARADPTGRVALAAQERASSADGGSGRIVAVDTDRLAAVAAWQPGWSGLAPAALRAALRPAHAAPVLLTGSKVTLTIEGETVRPGPLPAGIPGPPVPTIVLTVDPGGGWQQVAFPPLAVGRSSSSAVLPCPHGCRLVSIATVATPAAPYAASYTISALATDTTPATAFAEVLHDPKRWQSKVGPVTDPGRPWFATPTASPSGLKIAVHDSGGDNAPAVEPADRPDPLPAVMGPVTETAPFAGVTGAVPGVGLDGQAQLLRQVGRAIVLPRAMNDGVLVDLAAAQGLSDPAHSQATDEVWLAPGSHPAVERALQRAGVRILSRERLDRVATGLKQQAPTRAAVVSLLVAAVAALLTLVALVAARVVDAPARRRDWAALRAAGLSDARVRRLAVVEVAVPAAVAALLGAVAGLAAFALAVRRLPLRLADIGPPLDAGPSWSLLLTVMGASVALVVAVAVVLAASESRSTRGRRAHG